MNNTLRGVVKTEKASDREFPQQELEESDRTIKIKLSIYEKLAAQAKEQDSNIRKYTNELLTIMTNRHEKIRRMRPNLSLLAAEDESIFVRDTKAGTIAEVRVEHASDKDDSLLKLKCLADDSSEDCIHSAFAYGLFAVGLLTKLAASTYSMGGALL